MNKRTILPMAILALLASCSSEIDDVMQTDSKFDGQVTINVNPFEFDGETRTTLTLGINPETGKEQLRFGWKDVEEIGVFPVYPVSNTQAHHVLSSYENQGTVSYFDGAGWSLTRGGTYAAYYPFDPTMTVAETYEDIEVRMTGQKQNGDANLTHIGDGYDYMYAYETVPQTGDMMFYFNHATSIVQMNLTMPVAAKWTRITVSSKGNNQVFITKAKMNATNGNITPEATASSVVLDLDNVETTNGNMKLTLYLAMLPTTTGDVILTASTDGTYDYYVNLPSKKLVAGKAYRWTATLGSNPIYARDGQKNGEEYVDLGLSAMWAAKNIGALTKTDFGGYFAWGETEEKDTYNHATYKWSTGDDYTTIFKYTIDDNQQRVKPAWYNDNGEFIGDGISTLTREDDVANVKTSGVLRMPTNDEITELAACQHEWTNNYCGTGIQGVIFYKKDAVIPPANKLSVAHIFLPAAGYKSEDEMFALNEYIGYWAKELGGDSDYGAYIYGTSKGITTGGTRRYDGLSVRGVIQ